MSNHPWASLRVLRVHALYDSSSLCVAYTLYAYCVAVLHVQINITLQELNLSWNKLRPRGVVSIAEGLKPNLTLQVGYSNVCTSVNYTSYGYEAIKSALEQCTR